MPARIAITAAQFEAHAGEAAALLKVLANEHRLAVLCQLVAGELSVGELNARIALSQSALSQHLAVLRAEALVNTRREAQVIYYSLAEGPVHEIIETLHRIYCPPRARGRARTAHPAPVKAGKVPRAGRAAPAGRRPRTPTADGAPKALARTPAARRNAPNRTGQAGPGDQGRSRGRS